MWNPEIGGVTGGRFDPDLQHRSDDHQRPCFSARGTRRRYVPVAAAAKALLVVDSAPGDRTTEMM
jgi:hypothetical protein